MVWLSLEFLRQANKENDEVYTHVTLLPQTEVWCLVLSKSNFVGTAVLYLTSLYWFGIKGFMLEYHSIFCLGMLMLNFGYSIVGRTEFGRQRAWRVRNGWGRWGITYKINPSHVLQNTYSFWYQYPWRVLCSSQSCWRLFPSSGED